ncbi:MAG TPA: hypothetical protein VF525_14090 [Pyrinomonadaceae bacterium]|jgi:hypothetical protein
MYRLKLAFKVMLIGSLLLSSVAGLSSCTEQTPNSGNATSPANTAGSPGASPLVVGAESATAPAPASAPCQPFPVPTPPFVDDKLSPCIPFAVSVNGTTFASDVAGAQPAFDVFSWRSFVALNWPAEGGKTIGQDGDNPTVWETYNESYQVFQSDGSTPHWGPPINVPAQCKSTADASGGNVPVFRMVSKVSQELGGLINSGTVLDENGQPFKTGPLVDRNGNYLRFAIHMNKETFDYILANKLYNKEGQAAFTGPEAVFPAGDNKTAQVGSMVIKTAWRILDPQAGDKPERYHTIKAFVYTPASNDPPVAENCALKTLGLVGFHIMHKTTAAPQWIWSTFEQVDNVPTPGVDTGGVPATFYDPKHPERNKKLNQPPDKPWDPNKQATPSQITRLIPIDQPTIKLNGEWQDLLRKVNPNSVWQFYQLVSTQWPTSAKTGGFGKPAPPVLANATLETYTQRSSSCIACHKNATMTNSKPGDFSYLLQRAQPEKKQ